jgi:hypothetical protein
MEAAFNSFKARLVNLANSLPNNNKQGILYLFAPFILVCYFLFFSIINANLNGIVYLLGLFVGTLLTVFFGNGIVGKIDSRVPKNEMCTLITINHVAGISKVPVSTTVYSFTAAYLLYTAYMKQYIGSSIGPFLCLGLLLLCDATWQMTNNCFNWQGVTAAVVFASLFGVGWGYIINLTKNESLQYFAGSETACNRAKKQTFKCKGAKPVE